MRLLSTFAVIFSLSTISRAQEQIPLRSSGEMPATIANVLLGAIPDGSDFIKLRKGKLNGKEHNLLQKRIIGSGMIVYGDPVSRYCQEIADETGGLLSDYQIVTAKSNRAVAFSLPGKVICVTTGLVAQLTHEDQLRFFMLQVAAVCREGYRPFINKHVVPADNRDLISILGAFPKDEAQLADAIAFDDFIRGGYDKRHAVISFNVLEYSSLPFEDLYIHPDYFSSPLMYVPKGFFDVSVKQGASPNNNPYGINAGDTLFTRRKHVIAIKAGVSDEVTAPESLDESFLQARNLARMQSVYNHILSAEDIHALFAIATLEKRFGTSAFLARMKAHAWLGIVNQAYGNRTPGLPLRLRGQSEFIRFHRMFVRLNSVARVSIALRTVTDLSEDYPALKDEMLAIRAQMTQLIAASNRFPLTSFTDLSFAEYTASLKEYTDTAANKYIKINAARDNQQTMVADTNDFYFFGISDLMRDSTFTRTFIDNKTYTVSPGYPAFLNTNVNVYSRNEIQQEKSQQRSRKAAVLLDEIGEVSESYVPADNSSTGYYNANSLMLEITGQLFHRPKTTSGFIPLVYPELKKLGAGDSIIGFAMFETTYSLMPKPYHYLGLLLVPLPFMVADLTIGGNRTVSTILYVNTASGKVIYAARAENRNPSTPRMIKAAVYNSINFSHDQP